MLAAGAAFAHVLAERTTVVPQLSPCRPGESCLRELGWACRRPVAAPIRTPADGLGAHPHAESGIR